MLSITRFCAACAHRRHLAHGFLFAFALTAAGCSADVTRFDSPAFGLTESKATGSLPTPPETIARRPAYDDGPSAPPRGAGYGDASRSYGPPPRYDAGDKVASTRDYGPSASNTDAGPGPDRSYGRSALPPPAPERREPPRTASSGESIQVQQGDTLYGIAKRYGVSIASLIEVNGLTHGSAIKPGQRLALPAGAVTPKAAPEAPPVASVRTPAPPKVAARTPPEPAPAPAQAPPSGWDGRHTFKAGESLYGVARQYKVPLSELQRANGITEPTRVRAGTVLTVPGSGETAQEPRAPAAAPRAAHGQPATAPHQPRIINSTGEPRTAALGDRASDASPRAQPAPAADATAGRFRWPARGRVIASFGKRTDGTHNDGINIAVPQGTDVHAAEGGRVAYAGNELKGYGNLILIRHDNGWVSAYAHADQVLVKRDDVVRRGQVIAKAGKTGTVDQPQLHFELRQGAKPVDPLPHMER